MKEAQQQESMNAAAFTDMRTAKQAAIEAGARMAKQKEDELAKIKNFVVEAKENLAQHSRSQTMRTTVPTMCKVVKLWVFSNK